MQRIKEKVVQELRSHEEFENTNYHLRPFNMLCNDIHSKFNMCEEI